LSKKAESRRLSRKAESRRLSRKAESRRLSKKAESRRLSRVPMWDPEVAVGPALARQLLEQQFPEVASEPIEVLGRGWDNTVFTVGGEWVFRFPRREMVLPGIRNEIEFLPELAQLLPVSIPVPELVGVPSEAFPWPFFGARLLPGVELCEAPAL